MDIRQNTLKRGVKMKEKLKALLDSKTTWATLGVVAGTLLGDKAAMIVNALGSLVMTIIV